VSGTESVVSSVGAVAGARLRLRVRRDGPLVFVVLMLTSASMLGLGVLDFSDVPEAQPRIPLLVLAGVWLLLELVVLHLRFGKDLDNAEQITMSEVALGLGLLFSVPSSLLLAGVASSLLLELIRWRRRLIKLVFNVANRAFEVTVAITVYQMVVPPDVLSPPGWGALCLALTTSSLVSALDVATVISLSIGRRPGREFLSHVATAPPIALVGATVAFITGLALQAGSSAFAPLMLALVVLLVLMRSFSLLTERHSNLASLHSLGGRLAMTRDVRGILESTLDAVAELLMARDVAAYVPVPQDGSLVLRVARDAQGNVSEQVERREVTASSRRQGGDVGAMVARAPLAHSHELVLVASGRAESMRPFDPADAQLLDMVAYQAGPNVHTAQLIEQLRVDALRDPLTGLLNRRAVLDVTEEHLAGQEPIAILWLAVDLEGVNAALGHANGDELMVQVARRLLAVAGPSVVGRVSDQEFALVLRGDRGVSRVDEVVASLLTSLNQSLRVSGVEVLARVSVGVARAAGGTDGAKSADLLRRADIALRHARRTGNPVEHYRSELETTSPEKLALAAALQSGVARDELALYAQPQVRLSDGAVTGVEMLVRWNHPLRGLLSPAEFVPLAEQTGLDRPMTAWVLDASMRALAGWRASGLRLRASINVSAGALCDDGLTGRVAELMGRHGVSGDDLVVEVTEGVVLTSTERAGDALRSLSALGISVSIDDFGTGFSSLSHLRSLPVDEVKVDQSFVRKMLHSDKDEAVVRAVIVLGRGLGVHVVAEGIEDEQTYAVLRGLGCDTAQGYLMGRPMPVAELPVWLSTRQ
jgi:diguanylate cyclase (GGDEF)-like protein